MATPAPPYQVIPADVSRLPASLAEAIRSAEKRAAASPGDAEAVGALGLEYLAHGLSPSALRCFEAAAALAPRTAKWPYLRGLTHQRRVETPAALSAFERTLEIDPQHAGAKRRLAEGLIDRDADRAARLFEELVERDPNDAPAHFGWARCALAQDRRTAAREHLLKTLALAPHWPAARQAMARLLRLANLETQAAPYDATDPAAAEPTIHDDPLGQEVATRIADSTRVRREQTRAEVDQIASAPPKDAASGSPSGPSGDMVARVDLYLRQVADFERKLRSDLAAKPDDPSLLGTLSRFLRERGRFRESLALLRAAVERLPNDAHLRAELADSLLDVADTRAALEQAEQAMKMSPDSVIALFVHASVLAAVGDRDADALARLDEALVRSPRFAAAYALRGTLLARRGDSAAAEQAFAQAIQLAPQLPECILAYVDAPARRGNVDACAKAVLAGLHASPDSAPLFDAMARVVLREGSPSPVELTAARTSAESACALTDRRHARYLDTFARVLAKRGEYEEAIRHELLAIRIAEQNGPDALLPTLKQHLARFEANQPAGE
ncbi:MAG: tetratricopeptide repeat protein [Phycisphaerae bacterium]